jgi:hypothetical protein
MPCIEMGWGTNPAGEARFSISTGMDAAKPVARKANAATVDFIL